jgi:hypothetical protein
LLLPDVPLQPARVWRHGSGRRTPAVVAGRTPASRCGACSADGRAEMAISDTILGKIVLLAEENE